MSVQITAATEVDADIIAAIHLAAFDSNALLHAQFPTREALVGLQISLAQETRSSLQDPTKAVLVAKQGGEVKGFAKWDLPTHEKSLLEDITWPEGSVLKFLDEYTEKAEEAKERVVGKNPCYRLTFVAVDPKFQGRGIGASLTHWGLSRAEEELMPVYLESTVTAAKLYSRLGFVALDGFCMEIPGRRQDDSSSIYEELCMLKTWNDEDGMDRWDSSLAIFSLKLDYEAGIKPQHVIEAIYERIDAYKATQPSVWLHLQPISEVMRVANELLIRWPDPSKRPPLWGVPFSVKDSFDISQIPTTVGCPPLAFVPNKSAKVFLDCLAAGAIFIGKTNMEQLATGMTGCRSPYGQLHSTFSNLHSVGGSSSGSAITVSEGLVSFSLGSDTAGSIRVPAAFNGVVGFKPTKGTVSARGVYPACAHQDCVSFLSLNTEDAETIWRECAIYDKEDLFAKSLHFRRPESVEAGASSSQSPRFRFGIPSAEALEACDPIYLDLFTRAIKAIELYGSKVDLDWSPFAAANDLLYNGSFVLERLTIMPPGWFETHKDLIHPVIKQVFEGALARKTSAIDVFRDLHKQAEYKREVEDILLFAPDPISGDSEPVLTVMIVPTTPFQPLISDVGKDPIGINSKLGAFQHFGNVLDLCALAVPAGTYTDQEQRLPFGITILAGCGFDEELLQVVKGLEEILLDLSDEDEQ
ncbi:urea carboxylase [Phlyctema vagabunda]|uniref:Urea carboxylase n=1 Tax=Phlyctema vagabunda TaxID=108571 RepID=A0ABR4PC38_9HELO